MKIIVCVKRVIEPKFPLTLDLKSRSIQEKEIPYIMNPLDEVAVEEAVRIQEKWKGTEITLITVDPFSAEDTLRNCMAIGGDKVIQVWDESLNQADAYVTAQVLVKTIQTLQYDLILCGASTLDESSGLVGGEIAELLGIPAVFGITQLNISEDGKKAEVYRMLEGGDKEVVSCPLPAVFMVEKGLNTPRYPSLPAKMKAKKKEINRFDLMKVGFNSEEIKSLIPRIKVTNISYPTARTKKIELPAKGLSPEERIRFLMEGGLASKGGSILQGSSEEIAEKLLSFFIEQEFISSEH